MRTKRRTRRRCLPDALFADKRGLDGGIGKYRTLQLPEIVARLKQDGGVEVLVPEWEGSSFIPGVSDVSADIFFNGGGENGLE